MTRAVASPRFLIEWLRRHPFLAAACLFLFSARALLPWLARPALEQRVSALIEGQVRIDDVDFWLYRPAVALEGVRVFPSSEDVEPILGWKRLYVRIGWLDLLSRRLRVRSLRIDEPLARIDRLEDGGLNLSRLLPPAAPDEAAGEEPGAWTIAIDGLDSRAGSVEIRDLTLPAPQGLRIGIERVEVDHVSVSPGIYDEPTRLVLRARVDEAPLSIEANASPGEDGWRVDATAEIHDLPLGRARAYVPGAEWSGLRGRLDATLSYRLEPRGTHQFSGDLVLRDLRIETTDSEDPAFSVESLGLRAERIDLEKRAVRIGAVTLDGGSILVRRETGRLEVPVLPGSPAAAEESPGAPTSEAVRGAETPWSWSIDRLRVDRSRVLVRAGEERIEIPLELGVEAIGSDRNEPSTFHATVREGEGSLEASGTIRVAPLAVQATLDWKDLSLPRLATFGTDERLRALRAGMTEGSLEVQYAASGSDPAPDSMNPSGLEAHGRVVLSDVFIGEKAREPEENDEAETDAELSAELARLEVDAEAIRVAGGASPVEVRLRSLTLVEPRLRITYDEHGIVLGPLGGPKPSGAAPEAAGDSGASSPGQEVPGTEVPDTEEEAPAPASVRFDLAKLAVQGGSLAFLDRSSKPYYRGELSDLSVSARDVSWPDRKAESVVAEAVTPGGGRLRIEGEVQSSEMSLRIAGDRIGLPSYNPYVRKFSGYSIRRGAVSIGSTIRLREDGYQSDNTVSLHELELAGKKGASLFLQQFGIPLSLALALMRDVRGDIDLDIPVSGSEAGAELDLISLIGGALRNAILNAITSPLKLLGAVTMSGGKVESFDPEPVRFVPGTARLLRGSGEKLGRVGDLLSSHSGLVVRLQGTIDGADIRRLREREILEELRGDETAGTKEESPGPRAVIREYLEARAAGRPASLGDIDRRMLDALVAAREVPRERLLEIANARGERVRRWLEEKHGVSEQVQLEESIPDPTSEPGGVTLELDAH